MTLQKTEIAVIGGGMIGAVLAIGLAQQGLMVSIIEQITPPIFNTVTKQPDTRISALCIASVDLLRGLGIWNDVYNIRVRPYCKLEVWEWENAHVIFDSNELKLPYLGYIVENNILQQTLWKKLKKYPNVTLRAPSFLISMRRYKNKWRLELNNKEELLVNLVVGTDGANSQIRQMANIGIHARQYQQSCMQIIVQCEKDPGDTAWQYFTPSGPRAFLPLFDYWASLVWYDKPERIYQLQKLSILQLTHEIVRHFPSRIGKITPIAADAFRLTRIHAIQYIQEGIVLAGDSAHTIHPMIGQGVNVGYRDVEVLLDVINYARSNGENWASKSVLSRYQRRRMIDNTIMQLVADLFYLGFNNNLFPVYLLRNIGLITAQHSKKLKNQVLKYALGLNFL